MTDFRSYFEKEFKDKIGSGDIKLISAVGAFISKDGR